MPALLPAPGVARVAYSGTAGGAPWANVHHIVRVATPDTSYEGTAWTQAQITALAQQMRTAWNNNFAAVSAPDTILSQVIAQDLTSIAGVTGIEPTDVSGGLTAGPMLPAHCALVISWQESFHYRGGHCRTYMPAPTATQLQDARTWATAYQSQVATQAVAFLNFIQGMTSVSPQGCRKVVVHRRRAHADLNPPVVNFVSGASVDPRVDTMRKRLGPDVP